MALRIALLGCGALAARYAELTVAGGSTVLVVFGGDRDETARIAQQTGARIAPSLDDAVTAVGVDAVVACLGGSERLEAIVAAINARRPVFDAMPLSAEVLPTLFAAHDAGVRVGVDLHRRHDIGVREAADVVRNGEIGEVRSGRIVSRDETLAFQQSVVHDLDLARHLIGSDIVEVAGLEGGDPTMLLLRHANGVVISIENSQHAPAGGELRIELTGGAGIVSSGPRPQTAASVATSSGVRHVLRIDDAVARTLAAQWTSFADGVRGGTTKGDDTNVAASVATALRAVRAVEIALTEGRTVGLAELLSPS